MALSSNIVNLTPHDVHVFVGDGQSCEIKYRACGVEARCTSKEQERLFCLENNVPVWTPQEFTGVTGIEEIGADVTGIIVSMPVGHYLRDNAARFPNIARLHVYGPDTSPGAVRRDKDGRVAGTERLVLYYRPPSPPE